MRLAVVESEGNGIRGLGVSAGGRAALGTGMVNELRAEKAKRIRPHAGPWGCRGLDAGVGAGVGGPAENGGAVSSWAAGAEGEPQQRPGH